MAENKRTSIAHWFKSIISSNKFFYIVLALFSIQAIWFATIVSYRIPPDEMYHFSFITYYAEHQPLLSGPFIQNQPDNLKPIGAVTSIETLGNIERTTDYLYHYLLGVLMKPISTVASSTNLQILILRLINVAIVVLGIITFRKLFLALGGSRAVSNISILTLSQIGMLTWLAAAVNYDNLIFLLTGVALYLLVKLMKSASLVSLLQLLIIAILGLLVKKTFILIALPCVLIATYYFWENSKGSLFSLKKIKLQYLRSPRTVILLSLILFIVVGLFGERYIKNQMDYGSVNASCIQVLSEDDCRNNTLYARKIEVKKQFTEFQNKGGQVIITPMEFTGDWLDRMYDGLFFYFGHRNMDPSKKATGIYSLLILVVVAICTTYYSQRKVLETRADKILISIAFVYISALFLFNLNTYLGTATKYAFQGRYLLPVLPILIFYTIKNLSTAYKNLTQQKKKTPIYILGSLFIIFLYFHMPLLSFYRGSNVNWYTSESKSINSKIEKILNYTHLAPSNSYKNVRL